ncbi:MAG TPA: hypothetical protein VE442_14600 [Jatrophihabitans sp.]|jgi:hypothetical protein|nr:hypothetical protein [Jatrophihabitans sp.]
MTASAAASSLKRVLPTSRPRGWADLRVAGPTLFGFANAIAFFVIRPGVNDLWAARARASAAEHGVGLSYWFGWFAGGTTPGNYSVLTPYLCAAISTELVAALSAVAVCGLVSVLVRGTPRAEAAAAVGALAVVFNLWSGRVPFLLGAVPGVGALIAVRHGKRAATLVLTLLAVLASPVVGAFVALGLSGTFLTTRTKAYRPIITYAIGTAAVALVASALAFGTPGPEPISLWLLLQMAGGLLALWIAGPPDHVRTTMGVTVLAIIVLWAIPNGLGANLARFIWFGLAVAVVALSVRAPRIAAFAVIPVLIGGISTVVDLANAARPVSSVAYYDTLVERLDAWADLRDYRVEVVNHGARAGDDALLQHAWLARGWETQEDLALNKALEEDPLDPVTYKVWLDNNAVGYVALPSSSVGGYPEYDLVNSGAPTYLKLMWHDADWRLFRVEDPTPIVGVPASVVAHDQKSLTIRVRRAGNVPVRVRWSKFLSAVLQEPAPSGIGTVDKHPLVRAEVSDDGTGWTVLKVRKPGVYVLRGSLRGLLR